MTGDDPRYVKAALKGSTDWGWHGSASEHERYMTTIDTRSRQRCSCGCQRRATHVGVANGVALVSGCELSTRRWVKTR